MRNPLFQDVRVRQALQYLLNRELMNEKLMFNQYFLLNSYYPDLYPNNINPAIPPIPYDPDKARALLQQAGWQVGPDGILAKDGQPLDITILHYEGSDMRHLNIYMEDLKSVGIKAHVELTSQATWEKRIDNHEFMMVWAAWDASRLRDPEPMWSSKTADDIAGENWPGVKDPDVDKLIDAQKTEMDLDKRNDIDRQIDQRLMELSPYVLMWQSGSARILYWNRFGTPKYVLSKYSDSGTENDPLVYWWYDPAKAAALDDAMKRDAALPGLPAEVHYGQ
jgi:microcin C transport system substrate-binding protein